MIVIAKRKRNNGIRSKTDIFENQKYGSEYQPALMIQDVASTGRSGRIKGIKAKRMHSFLSDLERNYFYYLEFCDDVVDIREQFPLHLEQTQLIAEELGINHPRNPKTKELNTLTSDFCITLKNGNNIIRTIKPKEKLINKRTIEKFEIERLYWKRHNVDWGIVTEKEISKAVSLNIADMLSYYFLMESSDFVDISDSIMDKIIIYTCQSLIAQEQAARNIANDIEGKYELVSGLGLALIKYIFAHKYVRVDLSNKLDFNMILPVNANDMQISHERSS